LLLSNSLLNLGQIVDVFLLNLHEVGEALFVTFLPFGSDLIVEGGEFVLDQGTPRRFLRTHHSANQAFPLNR